MGLSTHWAVYLVNLFCLVVDVQFTSPLLVFWGDIVLGRHRATLSQQVEDILSL